MRAMDVKAPALRDGIHIKHALVKDSGPLPPSCMGACSRECRERAIHLCGAIHTCNIHLWLGPGRAIEKCRHLVIMRLEVLACRAPVGVEFHEDAPTCKHGQQGRAHHFALAFYGSLSPRRFQNTH